MKKIILMMFIMSFAVFSQEFTRAEKINGIKQIFVNGAAQVNVTKDSKETLTFTGKESIVKDITVKVKGSYLEIRMPKKSYFGFDDNVIVNISLEKLEDFEMQGTGNLIIKDFKSDDFKISLEGTVDAELKNNSYKNISITINGKSNLQVEGKTERVTAYVDGIGSLKAFALEAGKADIKLNGIGSVEISVKEELLAEVNGIGKITYKGNPILDKMELNGLGQIKKYEE